MSSHSSLASAVPRLNLYSSYLRSTFKRFNSFNSSYLDLPLLDNEEEAGSRWSREKFMWVGWPHFDPLGVTMEVVMLPG